MKAMIFAAGLGTRLKPYTLHHPKALVPLAGVPMLERVILKLKAIGVDEFVVNVHHFANQIIDFLCAKANFGCTIHISDETSRLLDTGGGILAARRWLDDGEQPFIVHNADILTDVDLHSMVRSHSLMHSEATLLVAPRKTSRYLLFDNGLRLRGWTNVKTGQIRPDNHELQITDYVDGIPGTNAYGITPLAFGGIHVMRPSIFKALEDFCPVIKPFSIIDFYVDRCTTALITGYRQSTPYQWYDIGKPEALQMAEQCLTPPKNI